MLSGTAAKDLLSVFPAKVVAIGFNKCATRSLAMLFAGAGHRVIHQKIPRHLFSPLLTTRSRKIGGVMRRNLESLRPVFEGVDDYIFYGDLIDSNRAYTFDGNSLFREIIRDYPGTILLLNWRDREDWIRSRLLHGHGEFAAREQRIRGVNSLEELCDLWRSDWDSHLAAVRAYMADKPTQLLEFNIDTDPIESLIARLPGYGLCAADYSDIGRSRGRKLSPVVKVLKRWIAYHKIRAQR